MSLDISLAPKKGVVIRVSCIYQTLLEVYPDSQLEKGDLKTLVIRKQDEHLADATISGERGQLNWGPQSMATVSSLWLNGSHEIAEVAETLLENLDLKDVSCGDEEEEEEEEEAGETGDFFLQLMEEHDRRCEAFNQTATEQQTELGLFIPEDYTWRCEAVACSPTCYAEIFGSKITAKDLRAVFAAFETEQRLRDRIVSGFEKELKRDWRKKILGVGLSGISLNGEFATEDSVPGQVTLFYKMATLGDGGLEYRNSTVTLRGGKIEDSYA